MGYNPERSQERVICSAMGRARPSMRCGSWYVATAPKCWTTLTLASWPGPIRPWPPMERCWRPLPERASMQHTWTMWNRAGRRTLPSVQRRTAWLPWIHLSGLLQSGCVASTGGWWSAAVPAPARSPHSSAPSSGGVHRPGPSPFRPSNSEGPKRKKRRRTGIPCGPRCCA